MSINLIKLSLAVFGEFVQQVSILVRKRGPAQAPGAGIAGRPLSLPGKRPALLIPCNGVWREQVEPFHDLVHKGIGDFVERLASSASVPSPRIAESVTFALNSAEYCLFFAVPMGSYADWLHLNALFEFPGPLLRDQRAWYRPYRGIEELFIRRLAHRLIHYGRRP